MFLKLNLTFFRAVKVVSKYFIFMLHPLVFALCILLRCSFINSFSGSTEFNQISNAKALRQFKSSNQNHSNGDQQSKPVKRERKILDSEEKKTKTSKRPSSILDNKRDKTLRDWKSGSVLLQENRKNRQASTLNPGNLQFDDTDLLDSYEPWWRHNFNPRQTLTHLRTLKMDEIKKELLKRNLKVDQRKGELHEALERALLRYSMGDDGFLDAPVIPEGPEEKLPSCFPDTYEDVYIDHGSSGRGEHDHLL